jgi:hypothetical protein
MLEKCHRATGFLLLFTMTALMCFSLTPVVMASDNPDKLTFTLEPYIWLPTLDRELKHTTLPNGSSGSPEIEIDADDLLEDLEMSILLTAAIRKGKLVACGGFHVSRPFSPGQHGEGDRFRRQPGVHVA